MISLQEKKEDVHDIIKELFFPTYEIMVKDHLA